MRLAGARRICLNREGLNNASEGTDPPMVHFWENEPTLQECNTWTSRLYGRATDRMVQTG